MPRVAVVTSHPIQYQAPWFRALAREVDLHVFFCHRQTPEGQAQAGFGQPFEWDVPLLDGYAHEWLTNRSSAPGVDSYGGCDTPEIRHVIAGGAFDACIVNGWYLKSYVQTIRACWAAGVPVLVRGDSQLPGRRGRLKQTAKYLPYRWFLRRIDRHLYVGQANREYLEHYGVPAHRLYFVPHFVDAGRFAADASHARANGIAEALRESWGAAAATVFVFAGKLIEKKRPADVLAAIASARDRGHAVHAVIVGSGPLESALRDDARARDIPVTFAGFQNQRSIASYYAAADCLVLPSDGRETWGLVVNEAMACGLPAIVSDAVGCGRDLVVEGRTGFTFPLGNPEALTDRIVEMHGALRSDRAGITGAVLERISRYTCDAALRGTLAAIDSLGAHNRSAVRARSGAPSRPHSGTLQ